MNEQNDVVHAFGFQSKMLLGCSASIRTVCVLALNVVCGVASSAGGGDYQCYIWYRLLFNTLGTSEQRLFR